MRSKTFAGPVNLTPIEKRHSGWKLYFGTVYLTGKLTGSHSEYYIYYDYSLFQILTCSMTLAPNEMIDSLQRCVLAIVLFEILEYVWEAI